MLGFEYAEATVNGNIYDPENDFPALLYYYGYLGAGLYLLFAAYFVFSALRALFRRGPRICDVGIGAAALMFCYALGRPSFPDRRSESLMCVYFFWPRRCSGSSPIQWSGTGLRLTENRLCFSRKYDKITAAANFWAKSNCENNGVVP